MRHLHFNIFETKTGGNSTVANWQPNYRPNKIERFTVKLTGN